MKPISIGRHPQIKFTSQQHIFLRQQVAPFHWTREQHEFPSTFNAFWQVGLVLFENKQNVLLRTFTVRNSWKFKDLV
jgi:hypothetical protein